MGRTCGTHGDRRNAYGVSVYKTEGKRQNIGGRLILNGILEKQDIVLLT
jgi:hypothetical protein